MKFYNIGIIGYGGFGKFLHHSWNNLKNIRITAVADLDSSNDPGGDIKFYNNWQDLIKDGEIDIVSIVTPPSSHVDIACAAMEGEKHIFLEKPIATTINDSKRTIETRDKTGQKATLNYMMRFNPIIETISSLSRNNVLGELRRVDVENYAQDSGVPSEHWLWNHDISGGILVEHAVHFIDLVHFLTDVKPQKVTGMCSTHNIKRENQVMANILYDNGLIATHYHSFSRPGFFEKTTIRLNFDLAQVDIEGWIPLSGNITALVNHKTEKRLNRLPGLIVQQNLEIDQIGDISRPKGWGEIVSESETNFKSTIRSGGVEYNVEKMITGTFNIARSKAAVYSDSVCAVLTDLINAIENSKHSLRVKLEDGKKSLAIAVLATKFGRS